MCHLNLMTLTVGKGHSTYFYLNSLMFIIKPLHVYHGQKFTIVHNVQFHFIYTDTWQKSEILTFLNTFVVC